MGRGKTLTAGETLTTVTSTGIKNLDYLLGGGFHVSDGRYPSVIIKGVPGTGKSILSATIAARIFHSGRSAAYFTLEQKAADIQRMVMDFEWHPADPESAFYLDDDYRRPSLPTFLEPVFLISHYPITTLKAGAAPAVSEDERPCFERAWEEGDVCGTETVAGEGRQTAVAWDAALREHVKQRIGALPHCGVIVLDALSEAFCAEESDTDHEYYLKRSLFQAICDLGTQQGALVIVILEKDSVVGWRNYVADAVIDLSWQPTPEGNLRRYIHVEKARFHEIADGRHEMRIVAKKGIVVYPCQHEVLRRAQRDQLQHGRPPRLLPFCTHSEFNKMLDRKILEGSSSLLFGSDATHKKVVVSRFLQEGLQDSQDPEECVLFLAVGTTRDVARKMIADYLQCDSPGTRSPTEIEAMMRRVIVRPITGFTETPDELVNEVRWILDEKRICRAAVDDVAALLPGPEAAFPLKELFTFRNITSLFVHTVGSGEESLIREHFDTVIRARHLLLPNSGRARIGYLVSKLNGATKGATRSWELRYDEKTGALTVRDAFQEYVEGKDGELRHLPVRMIVQSEFEDRQKGWQDQIHALFVIAGSGVATADAPGIEMFARPEAEAVLDQILLLEPEYDTRETRVVNFDDYWAPDLMKSGKLERIDDFVDGSVLTQFHDLSCRKISGEMEGRRVVYGLPHHIDCGFYAIRTDVVSEKILARAGVSLEHALTWDDLAALAQDAQHEFGKQREPRFVGGRMGSQPAIPPRLVGVPRCFGYWTRIDEYFVCYVLEVLWPFLFGGGRFRGFRNEQVARAAFRWYKILEKTDSLPGQTEEDHEPAIVQRHWIVSYWKMLHDHPKLEQSLRIIPQPALSLDSASPPQPAASISGDWFLGIVKGSPNPGRGVWAMKALTSKAMNRRMYENRLAFPAHKSLLDYGEAKDFRVRYESSVSRSQIPDYLKVRPILIETFREIFGRPGRTAEEIAGLLGKVDDHIR